MSNYTCPYCGTPASIRDSSEIYGRSYGLALICARFPTCNSFVGCHVESGLPKGTIANAELREWRKRAHAAFDPVWKDGTMNRHAAYKWLAMQLKIERDECHIGMFNVDMCREVVRRVGSV